MTKNMFYCHWELAPPHCWAGWPMGAAALSAAQSEGPADHSSATGYLGAPAAAAAGAAAAAAAAGMPPAGVGSLAQSLAAGPFQSSSLGGAPTTAPSDLAFEG